MPKNRLEAFSDGVIAIVITLLVLEIHVPQTGVIKDNAQMLRILWNLIPYFTAYFISFLICAVWWVFHHNFIHDLLYVDRPLLWANNHFLLWLVFLPFPTALLGQHPTQPIAAAFYGLVGSLTSLSFWIMRRYASNHKELMREDISQAERLRRVRISAFTPLLYLAGGILSFLSPIAAIVVYAAVPTYFAIANPTGGKESA